MRFHFFLVRQCERAQSRLENSETCTNWKKGVASSNLKERDETLHDRNGSVLKIPLRFYQMKHSLVSIRRVNQLRCDGISKNGVFCVKETLNNRETLLTLKIKMLTYVLAKSRKRLVKSHYSSKQNLLVQKKLHSECYLLYQGQGWVDCTIYEHLGYLISKYFLYYC